MQESQHGSGVFHVIGGAGGKLNYMKLRGLKPESDYKKDLAERSAQRRQIDKQQRARDKELGLSEPKAQARQKVQQQEKDARRQFVSAVGQALGWKPEETGFDEAAHASLSDEARAAVREKHEAALFERAKAAVEQSKQVLVTKAQERPEAGLGGVALDETAPDKLDVSDIAPVAPEGAGLGFAPKFAEEAKKSGLTDEERKQEAEAARLRANPDAKPREPKPATGRKEVAERVAQELATVREEAPTPSPEVKDAVIEAAQAAEVLKAAKALKATQRQAKQAKKEIDKATAEPKAYNITYTIDDAAGRQAEADVADSVRTARTRAFLSQVQELAGDDPEKTIGRHLGVGAYNAINAAALAITGDSLVDRLVVDVLGVEGAANVLARRLHSAFPDRVEELTGALQDYHVDHYMKASEEAISEARDLVDTAKEIQLGAAHDGLDLAAMIEINRRRGDALGEAKRVLGTTLGEMEANAALGVAMQAPKASVEVPLNDMSTEDAITRARAIGLKRGDYTVDTVAGKRVLTVNAEGLDRLSKPVDRASLEQVKRNLEIISGTHDEPNWLPLGFARRDDLDNPPAPGAAPQLAEPFKPGPDLQQSLRDYIGGRMADGDAPGDIVADIQSQAFFEQAGDSDAYRAALDAVAPLKSDDGKMVRPDDHQGRFEGYADDFVGRRYGGEVSPLHRQNFEQGHAAQDALHRALAEHPSGVAAFKPIGELTPQDQRALRDHFYKHLGREDEHGAAMRQQLEDLDASPPERETTDMFGETTENPEWTDWKQRRDGLAEEVNKSSFTWPKYVEAMHGTAKAYEAMQDLIRSNVAQAFQKHYNTLNPGKPLKLGKTVVRNNLNHLDAVDPDAREERAARERSLVDSLRERSAGRYAEGAVSDKLDADERYTLGHAAERSLAGLMPVVGENFKPGAPVKLFNPSMSGQFAAQQRAIKYLDANKRMAAALGVGSGKAQPLDAKILTPNGWRRMGDMAVGDKVIAGDGSVVTVTGVYPQGIKPIYKVMMADGGATECCDEHLWKTTTEVERKRIAYSKRGHKPTRDRLPTSGSVRSLAEIRATLTVRHGINNHHIPLSGLPEFTAKQVPVAPYLLGALLGDGCLSAQSTVRFSSVDEEMLGFVEADLPDGLNLYRDSRCDYRITCGKRGGGASQKNYLVQALTELGLAGSDSGSKFIPDLYLQNTYDVRLQVLRGLMDTDGCAEAGGVHCTFTSISLRLTEGVEFLVRSLGGIARRKTKIPKYRHNGEVLTGKMAYVLTITMPPNINPFRLSRKANKVVPKSKYAPRGRVIASVTYIGEKEAQCIRIDHPSHLYITDDFIVTHNTSITLGGFSHLHGQGKIKKGIFAVPSIVQGQFHAEALRFLEPGKFKWHAQPGASREERIAAYKDPGTHFSVVTHASLRDDMIHLGAKHAGIPEAEMADKVRAMSRSERKDWMRKTCDAEGINWDYMAVDEGHDLLNRAGKEDSILANVADSISDNSSYYINASGDPVKNDVSEAFDLLSKMEPSRYTDRAAFMRRYGVDTAASKEALRREMARYVFPHKIEPKVRADKQERHIKLSDGQQKALKALDMALGKARLARMRGKVDVDAVKAISPDSFADVPDDQHEALARNLMDSVGILKETAQRKIIDDHPQSAKLDDVSAYAAERKGKPGVVFAHSRAAVEHITKRLQADGHRVVTITGSDSAKEKDAKRLKFRPEQGEAEADILVLSDAGAVGLNAQRGQWMYQYDSPATAKTHAQRNGRIHRMGQVNDVELADAIADHPSERRARDRLKRKYELRDIMTSPLEGLDDTGLAFFLKRRQAEKEQGGLF